MKSQNNKIVFGLKVRQLRNAQNASFALLAEQTGMSVSYLNEIEKGKKYPKEDKIKLLAKALNTTPESLTNQRLPKSLEPVETLLQSNFLNELPLDLFGIDLAKVVEIIANAPLRVGAFISTLVELSRNYALREENFYFAALRSYLELHNNYFEDIEVAVSQFVRQHKIATDQVVPAKFLGDILENKLGYTLIENGLADYPELKNIRSVFVPKSNKLLLNASLNEQQRAFQFGKELGFHALGLKERAYTSSLLRVKTFDEALNHFKAGYFSAALLMNLDAFNKDIEQFLSMPKWDNGAIFERLITKYGATPEMLFQRITNVLPQFFGLSNLFFLRFVHNLSTNKIDINKELHLNQRHHPHGNGLDEHYCRRWISISLLKDLQNTSDTEGGQIFEKNSENPQNSEDKGYKIGIQKSRYLQTDDEYLCFTVVRHASKVRNASLTIGILIDAEARKRVHFLSDPDISSREVSTTCERCAVVNCAERAAEPSIIQRRENWARLNDALGKILDNK
ncbi:MAG: helix-turn-helix domain-containing protein [Saprospiraceae bacterium]|nr:helix-turn-helix domain-containing protein [Saprospiraceae bacterium]